MIRIVTLIVALLMSATPSFAEFVHGHEVDNVETKALSPDRHSHSHLVHSHLDSQADCDHGLLKECCPGAGGPCVSAYLNNDLRADVALPILRDDYFAAYDRFLRRAPLDHETPPPRT